MKLIQIIAIIVFQSALCGLVFLTSVERTNDDYINPLLESFEFDINHIEYEAKWLAVYIENLTKSQVADINSTISQLRNSLYEPYQTSIAEKVNPTKPPEAYNLYRSYRLRGEELEEEKKPEKVPEKPFKGIKNQRLSDEYCKSCHKFEGSYQVLGNLIDALDYKEQYHIWIFGLYKVLYGLNRCRLTVSGRTFKVEPQVEKVTIFPKLKEILLTRWKELTSLTGVVIPNEKIVLQPVEQGKYYTNVADLDELFKYSGERTLKSDFELFEAARDTSLKGYDGITKLVPSIDRSRRFCHMSDNVDSVKKVFNDVCKYSSLKNSVQFYVLSLGIDACSLDVIENMSPVFAKSFEYYRLCNELAVTQRNSMQNNLTVH